MKKMRIFVVFVFVLVMIAMTTPMAVHANLDDYLNNPGRQQATEVSAQCGTGAGSGSFQYFGQDYNMGINYDPSDPGANGYQTGLNNSAVCGNR